MIFSNRSAILQGAVSICDGLMRVGNVFVRDITVINESLRHRRAQEDSPREGAGGQSQLLLNPQVSPTFLHAGEPTRRRELLPHPMGTQSGK